MNEEEKKAIEKIKEIIECFYCFPNPTSIELKDCDCSTLEISLNLIEKMRNCIIILDDELKERNKTINEKEIIIEQLQKENEHKAEKIENQKNELAILNEKQKDFNKLKNTAKSWEGQYRRTLKENKNLKATNKDLQKSVDMIYADYQDIGNKAFEYSDKIEQLQKENIELKAKLEYKEYGDLDNIEFEKYINYIVDTRTKELKEENEKLKYKYAEYVKFSIRKIEEMIEEEGNK